MSGPLVINGWTIYAHPLFLAQLQKRIAAVEGDRSKDPKGYASKANAKFLAALNEIAFKRIPQDPGAPRYRQGVTLGDEFKHWFRDKFFQRYRLFFRYDSNARIIVYAWVNDEQTKRTYGAKSDAYAVFADMIADGNPPDDWAALLAACQSREAQDALSNAATKADVVEP